MSIECGECELDLRWGHAEDCSRREPIAKGLTGGREGCPSVTKEGRGTPLNAGDQEQGSPSGFESQQPHQNTVTCRECGCQTKSQAHCEFCGERP
jgi:hypothetical protein